VTSPWQAQIDPSRFFPAKTGTVAPADSKTLAYQKLYAPKEETASSPPTGWTTEEKKAPEKGKVEWYKDWRVYVGIGAGVAALWMISSLGRAPRPAMANRRGSKRNAYAGRDRRKAFATAQANANRDGKPRYVFMDMGAYQIEHSPIPGAEKVMPSKRR
jgi:hypothetical protein